MTRMSRGQGTIYDQLTGLLQSGGLSGLGGEGCAV
jgi:hypothetical protein